MGKKPKILVVGSFVMDQIVTTRVFPRQAGVHVETRGTVTYAKTVTDLDSDAKFPERNVFVVLGVDRAGFAAHITEALSSYAG